MSDTPLSIGMDDYADSIKFLSQYFWQYYQKKVCSARIIPPLQTFFQIR